MADHFTEGIHFAAQAAWANLLVDFESQSKIWHGATRVDDVSPIATPNRRSTLADWPPKPASSQPAMDAALQ